MKRTFITGSLIAISLLQSVAQAQLIDLPDPGGDDGGSSTHTPVTPTTPAVTPSTPATQYAGTLRLSTISRKTGGQVYKLDLTESFRLQRIDIRVAQSRAKIHRGVVVTESGLRLNINQFTDAAIIENSGVLASENITTNERIKTIEITAEGYGGDTDIIITALADAGVPKLSLRQEVPVQPPVVTQPTTPIIPDTTPVEPNNPYTPGGGSITYYGQRFQSGDRVLYRQRYLGTVAYAYDNERVSVEFDGGYQQVIYSSDLAKSTSCYQAFCQGARVLYNNQHAATIVEAFDNGVFNIQFDANYQTFLAVGNSLRRYTAPVRRTQECTNDRRYCLGDRVTHPQGFVVTIVAIYSDGTVDVRDAAGTETVRASQLRPVGGRRGGSIINW